MGIEIERKFLVRTDDWRKLTCVKQNTIKQGYLSKSYKHTVRIRLTNTKALITIKGPTKGLSRAEYEYPIPVEDGAKLINLCDEPIINKTRFIMVDEHGQQWDIDEFEGINAGLVLAEIEMFSETTEVILPPWIGKEVTHDKRYTNTYLCTHKVPAE